MQRLHPGNPFPTITGTQVGGGTVTLPAEITTAYSVVLAYRAYW